MTAGDARVIAARWVSEQLARTPGETRCVFTHGSINWMADDEPFPPSSDVDIAFVVPEVAPGRHRVFKRTCDGIAIEAFYLPIDRLTSADSLLTDFALAPNLVSTTALFDPNHLVEELKRSMQREFPRRYWMRLRCRALRQHALSIIAAFAESDSLVYLNAVACLAVRAMAQMALLADLRNPTVKKALVKARDVLSAYGVADEQQELLRVARYTDLDAGAILGVTSRCRQTLTDASRLLRTPFIGDNCVTVCSLPALDIDVPTCVASGTGREIFLWVETLYAHAMIALQNDAPAALLEAATRIYHEDLAWTDSATVAQARARMLACRPALDRMIEVSDRIVADNTEAID
jgi:hypothetical protein